MTGRRRVLLLALLVAVALMPASRVLAQSGPIQATIFFKNPPPGAIPAFSTTAPITIVVQVQNISGGPIPTTIGFSRTEFWRLLYFHRTTGGGPAVVNTSGGLIHQDLQVAQCLSLGGAPQSPAIPVVPVEILAGPPGSFFIEYVIPDAHQFYALEPGQYRVNAVVSFSAFAPGSLITTCDNFAVPVVNVGAGAAGRQDFTVLSNNLDFRIAFTFVGFLPPLGSEASCQNPCLTTNLGNTVPVKFQLLDASGATVKDAVARISVTQVSGTPPPQPPTDLGQGSQPTNTFKFGSSANQYVFNLDTSVLSRGVWRINVSLSDGSVHTAEIRIR